MQFIVTNRASLKLADKKLHTANWEIDVGKRICNVPYNRTLGNKTLADAMDEPRVKYFSHNMYLRDRVEIAYQQIATVTPPAQNKYHYLRAFVTQVIATNNLHTMTKSSSCVALH
jgi:hypothetical protein